MIVFPIMLVTAAQEANMPTPPDPDNFDHDEYPHFSVFCTLQLGVPMSSPNNHWVNAQLIADISISNIKTITLEEIIELGFTT